MNANRIYAAQLGISATAHVVAMYCTRRDAKRIAELEKERMDLLVSNLRNIRTCTYLLRALNRAGVEVTEFDVIAINEIQTGEV